MEKDYKAINGVVKRGTLQQIQQKAQELHRLQSLIQSMLPEPLAQHCQVLNYHENQLVIGVKSAAWGQNFKQHQAQLLRQFAFQELTSGFKTIKLKILMAQPKATKPKEKKILLSNKAKTVLEDAADHVRHPRVREALQRLANNKTKK